MTAETLTPQQPPAAELRGGITDLAQSIVFYGFLGLGAGLPPVLAIYGELFR